ncbi:SagB/ThcOx family dehydrogenase [Thermosulfurimonas marina]|uniref:SagB/ThcOx family dehydrogenase n=1 Tax=Thermosulfurimonas marina TaxID=2047767 RepID=A0A6H1WRG0_9BACT|nr:SagB/ThcOx family dehydrogenase [Thermosulfurimonas marina]QJA05782.1 SagB/ThcOx family dehydrogenase [Thermosulfurimonas marina]
MPDYRRSLGFTFLEGTKLRWEDLFREREEIAPAPYFKSYPQAPQVPLPRVRPPAADLFEVLARRRSERIYARRTLTLEELSLLLWAAQGVTARAGRYLLRTAPSAGALYPIETYLSAHRVEGLEPGLYHLEIETWSLAQLSRGNFGPEIKEAALGQGFCETAAAVFVWSAVPRRTMAKYGSRGLRYIFLDAGHLCQNMLLAAEALKLAACPVGAFLDEALNEIFGLDGEEETVIYLATVGHPGR